MGPANDIAEFLTPRRATVIPEQVGLPTYVPRRVKGLRREEVASLAAIDALDTGQRGGPEPDDITLEAFGMAIAEA